MRYFSSIVLDVMRHARVYPPPTLGEIEKAVRNRIIEENSPRGQHGWFLSPGMTLARRLSNVQQALLEAEDLGLVIPIGNSEGLNENQRWRVADTWQPPWGSGREGGDGGAGGGDRGRGDGDGDQRRGGLVEALSHPVLFSLDKDSFEAVIEGLFVEGRS